MIITISGKPGSGKSTVAKRLAAELGLTHVSAGDFMRDMATERGITVLELSAIAENDDTWREFIPYNLVWAGGRLGRVVARAVFAARNWHEEIAGMRAQRRARLRLARPIASETAATQAK